MKDFNNIVLIGQKVRHKILGEGTIIEDNFPYLNIVFDGVEKNPIRCFLATSLLENMFSELEDKSAVKAYLNEKPETEDKSALLENMFTELEHKSAVKVYLKEKPEEKVKINKQKEISSTQKMINDKIGWIIEDTSLLIKKISGIKASVKQPPLSSQDIRLALRWSSRLSELKKELESNPTEVNKLLFNNHKNYELGRVLSARAAEKAAASFYNRYGLHVKDISISQLSEEGKSSDWRLYDFDVEGKFFLDVKNSRRSKNSPERYTEHCVPEFKKKDQTVSKDVIIVGTLSEYLYGLDFTDMDPFTKKSVIYLGELDKKKIDYLRNSFQDENLILDFSEENKMFFPPWLFDYPEFVYKNRKQYIRKTLMESATEYSIWKMSGQNYFPVFIAKGIDIKHKWGKNDFAEWQWKFYDELLRLPEKNRISLPFVFLTVLKNFIKNVVSGNIDHSYRPERYREFLYFGNDKSSLSAPLFIFDPLKTVDELINSLNTLWQGNHSLIKDFKKFKLVNGNILQGKTLHDQKWKTLIAYCGGKDGKVKCGKTPLVLGDHRHCSCGKLICDECGFCSKDCSQMLLEGRNQK
jgi:hypothetical protein